MRLQSLKHTAGVVRAIAQREQVIVLGSSSLLATFPTLGENGQLLESSLDADFLLEPCDEELAAILDEAVGAERKFQFAFGYCADILRPEITSLLPTEWRARLIPLPDCDGVSCLDPHDLAVAKLQAGRPKDITLLGALLAAGMLDEKIIRQRIDQTRLQDKMVITIFRRLKEVVEAALAQHR